MKNLRAGLIELFQRLTPEVKDKDKRIYWNGAQNLYPYEIERIINNSPTAFRASKMMGKFIAGAGVLSEANTLIPYKNLPFVNKKGNKITDIIRIGSQSLSKQGGCYFHISYGIDDNGVLYQKGIDIVDYVSVRKSKEADDDGERNFYVKDWEKKSKTEKWFYPYNPDKEIVLAQIKKDAGSSSDLETAIKKYRGQIYYLNLTPEYKYALAPVDAVYNDADSEYRMALYTNTQTRTGFLGKQIFLTSGLDAEQSGDLKEDLATFMGAENSGDMYHLDVEASMNLDEILKVIPLKAQFDDKLFDSTDRRLRRNILGAFNNIPEALVNASDSALFGTSAEAYEQMKLFYSEQTEEEREKLEETLSYLGFYVRIKPIIEAKKSEVKTLTIGNEEKPELTDETAKAQAALRGSVGGVQGILGIQQSVSQGLTDFESAITILMEIYGFDRAVSSALLGKPEIKEDTNDLQ